RTRGLARWPGGGGHRPVRPPRTTRARAPRSRPPRGREDGDRPGTVSAATSSEGHSDGAKRNRTAPEATMRPTIAEERRKGGWEAAGQDGRNRPSHPGGSEERREGGGRRARAAAGDLLGRDGGCRGRCRHGSNRGQQPHVVPRRGRGTR